MSDVETTATAEGCEHIPLIFPFGPPPNCRPDRFPNWRMHAAMQLTNDAHGQIPSHEDPWIDEAAKLAFYSLSGNRDWRPSGRQRRMVAAIKLHGSLLVRAILQAHLLKGRTAEEIAQKSTLDQRTIAAYSALLYDVTEPERARLWYLDWQDLTPQTNTTIWKIARIILMGAFSGGPNGADDMVDILCDLNGPTMADGLPNHDAPKSQHLLMIRRAIAAQLLRPSKANDALVARFDQIRCGEPSGSPLSEAAFDISMQILQKAKVSVALRRKIKKIRRLFRPETPVATAAEPDSAAELNR